MKDGVWIILELGYALQELQVRGDIKGYFDGSALNRDRRLFADDGGVRYYTEYVII